MPFHAYIYIYTYIFLCAYMNAGGYIHARIRNMCTCHTCICNLKQRTGNFHECTVCEHVKRLHGKKIHEDSCADMCAAVMRCMPCTTSRTSNGLGLHLLSNDPQSITICMHIYIYIYNDLTMQKDLPHEPQDLLRSCGKHIQEHSLTHIDMGLESATPTSSCSSSARSWSNSACMASRWNGRRCQMVNVGEFGRYMQRIIVIYICIYIQINLYMMLVKMHIYI